MTGEQWQNLSLSEREVLHYIVRYFSPVRLRHINELSLVSTDTLLMALDNYEQYLSEGSLHEKRWLNIRVKLI